jgi:hypothetical protein
MIILMRNKTPRMPPPRSPTRKPRSGGSRRSDPPQMDARFEWEVPNFIKGRNWSEAYLHKLMTISQG